MATNVSFVLIKKEQHSFWCGDAALEKFGSNKIISLFLCFRDRNSEITTKDMWNHSFWRPVLGGKIIYAAKPKGRASYAKLHLLPPAQQKQLSKAPLMSAIAKRAIPTSRIQPLEQKGWTPNTSVKLPELIVRMQCSSGFKTSQQIEPSSNMSHGSSETEPPIARIKVTPFILTIILYKITIFGFLYKCHLTVFR